jgi:hypothetical protein
MGLISQCVVAALATFALAVGVQARQGATGAMPPTQMDVTASLQVLQTAVDNKDATAIFNTLLSANLTGGFGFATTNASGLLIANLVVTENQNQTQVSPN